MSLLSRRSFLAVVTLLLSIQLSMVAAKVATSGCISAPSKIIDSTDVAPDFSIFQPLIGQNKLCKGKDLCATYFCFSQGKYIAGKGCRDDMLEECGQKAPKTDGKILDDGCFFQDDLLYVSFREKDCEVEIPPCFNTAKMENGKARFGNFTIDQLKFAPGDNATNATMTTTTAAAKPENITSANITTITTATPENATLIPVIISTGEGIPTIKPVSTETTTEATHTSSDSVETTTPEADPTTTVKAVETTTLPSSTPASGRTTKKPAKSTTKNPKLFGESTPSGNMAPTKTILAPILAAAFIWVAGIHEDWRWV